MDSNGYSYLYYSVFTTIYNKDKEIYGDLASCAMKAVPVAELDNWQVVLQAHAKNIELLKQQVLSLKKQKTPPTWDPRDIRVI